MIHCQQIVGQAGKTFRYDTGSPVFCRKRHKALIRSAHILIWLLLIAVQLHAQDFTRISEGPLVNDDRYSEGSAWGDINNDNLLDVFVPDAFTDRSNLLFLNNGDGTFTQLIDSPVVTDTSTSSGCSFGDFDNDGNLDLFVQNWNGLSSHLYMNNGNGTFTKVTSGQIVNDAGWSFNSSICII